MADPYICGRTMRLFAVLNFPLKSILANSEKLRQFFKETSVLILFFYPTLSKPDVM